jgi:hypothetical protein
VSVNEQELHGVAPEAPACFCYGFGLRMTFVQPSSRLSNGFLRWRLLNMYVEQSQPEAADSFIVISVGEKYFW